MKSKMLDETYNLNMAWQEEANSAGLNSFIAKHTNNFVANFKTGSHITIRSSGMRCSVV
jgi:hypothetical protein